LYENFTCGAEGNYDHYCNPELDKMVEQQSMEFDQKKRKELVWAIERKLAEDAARPILQRDKQDEKAHCLTGECSRDVERCLTKRAPVASPMLRPSPCSLSDF